MKHFTVVVERDREGWLVGSVPALPGCHAQARTSEELNERMREVIALCLESRVGDTEIADPPEFVEVRRLAVAA